MIELLELKFSRRWQANKIESDWSNSPRHSFSRQFRSPRTQQDWKFFHFRNHSRETAAISKFSALRFETYFKMNTSYDSTSLNTKVQGHLSWLDTDALSFVVVME